MAESAGFDWGSLMSGVNDTFKSLAGGYLTMEQTKAQAGALKAQAEYNALTGYNSSYISSPNAVPWTAAEYARLQAAGIDPVTGKRAGLLGDPMMLAVIGGGVLLIAVLVLK